MAAFPLYILLGASNTEGIAAESGLPDVLQTAPTGTRIWNNTAGADELLVHDKDGTANNSTYIGSSIPGGGNDPEDSDVFGPEMTLFPRLRQRHGAFNKVFFLKWAAGASSIGGSGITSWAKTASEEYATLQSRYSAFKTAVLAAYPGDVTDFDIRGFFMVLGEADAAYDTDSAAFETNFTTFVSDLRTDFTDTTLTTIPIIHALIRWDTPTGDLNEYNPIWIDRVRTAQRKVTHDLANMALYDTTDIDLAYYTDVQGNLHYDAASALRVGTSFNTLYSFALGVTAPSGVGDACDIAAGTGSSASLGVGTSSAPYIAAGRGFADA